MTEVNAQIVVDLAADDDYPAFRDAIYVPMDEYRRLSASQIEALKQERIDNWRATLDAARNQPVEEAPAQQPVTSVEQARTILNDALAALDALPADPE